MQLKIDNGNSRLTTAKNDYKVPMQLLLKLEEEKID